MKAAWGGLGVSVIVLGLKFAAYWVTGSVALYSDELETTINVVGALTAPKALFCNGPFVVNPLRSSFAGSLFCPWSAPKTAGRHLMG